MTLIRSSIELLFNNLLSMCAKLNRSQKLFFWGIFVFFFSCISMLLPFHQLTISSIVLSCLLLVFGVTSDILIIFNKVWSTLLGKSLILLLYALATAVSYGMAGQIVNDVVKFDVKGLNNVVLFVSVIIVPLFIFSFTYILFFFFLVFSQFYFVFALQVIKLKDNPCWSLFIPSTVENYPVRTLFMRVIIYPFSIFAVWTGSYAIYPSYANFVEKSASFFIFHFEAVKYSRCATPKGAKAISINDHEVILVTDEEGEYIFRVSECIPVINVKP